MASMVKQYIPKFDNYTIKARIQPIFVVMLPLGILLFVLMPGESLSVSSLLGIIVICGGTSLLSQIARDRGGNRQPALWDSWGGAPTTRLLRFRDSPNRITLENWRAKLEKLTGRRLPTEEEEKDNPVVADQHYEAAVHVLRNATYDAKKFSMVFAETINYGFRRNLWGMKPYGIILSTLATICSWGISLWSMDPTGESWFFNLVKYPDVIFLMRMVGTIVNTVITAIWLFVIRPEWVRTTAEAYALQLLGALDALVPTLTEERKS